MHSPRGVGGVCFAHPWGVRGASVDDSWAVGWPPIKHAWNARNIVLIDLKFCQSSAPLLCQNDNNVRVESLRCHMYNESTLNSYLKGIRKTEAKKIYTNVNKHMFKAPEALCRASSIGKFLPADRPGVLPPRLPFPPCPRRLRFPYDRCPPFPHPGRHPQPMRCCAAQFRVILVSSDHDPFG